MFTEINKQYFDGFLDVPVLKWNSRLRSSSGRFIPGSRKWFREQPPVIEVASYLKTIESAEVHIRDTLAHEMIHYWLWVRRRPYGHTEEFWSRMKAMGVSRYNTVPKLMPVKYLYQCPGCLTEFPAHRKLGRLACSRCCKDHAGGKFDPRFALAIFKKLGREEGLELKRELLERKRSKKKKEIECELESF